MVVEVGGEFDGSVTRSNVPTRRVASMSSYLGRTAVLASAKDVVLSPVHKMPRGDSLAHRMAAEMERIVGPRGRRRRRMHLRIRVPSTGAERNQLLRTIGSKGAKNQIQQPLAEEPAAHTELGVDRAVGLPDVLGGAPWEPALRPPSVTGGLGRHGWSQRMKMMRISEEKGV